MTTNVAGICNNNKTNILTKNAVQNLIHCRSDVHAVIGNAQKLQLRLVQQLKKMLDTRVVN